jgi:hypothetical protein
VTEEKRNSGGPNWCFQFSLHEGGCGQYSNGRGNGNGRDDGQFTKEKVKKKIKKLRAAAAAGQDGIGPKILQELNRRGCGRTGIFYFPAVI